MYCHTYSFHFSQYKCKSLNQCFKKVICHTRGGEGQKSTKKVSHTYYSNNLLNAKKAEIKILVKLTPGVNFVRCPGRLSDFDLK